MDRAVDAQLRYAHVRVQGGPRERGRQYGELARERIARSREAYEQVFAHGAGWDWQRVTDEALRFREPIRQFEPGYLEEMRGLAEGAALPAADILALNVRTEIMYAAKARQALAQAGPVATAPGSYAAPGSADAAGSSGGTGVPGGGECTAFAALPGATADGHTLVGQNWDWLLHAFETVVVLEARQDGKPDYVTVVEAGLLAKSGMNSSGIGLATNALVTTGDLGRPGLPYHVLLRAILDAESVTDALVALQAGTRSSSANYLIASQDGVALDVEAAPGDFSRLSVLLPDDLTLVHTNHFQSPRPGVEDISLWAMPDSAIRLQRARGLVHPSGGLSPSGCMAMLADHADYPFGICAHADGRQAPLDQSATIASIVMDVNTRRLWLADGQPCRVPYRELDYTGFLSKGPAAGLPRGDAT